MHDFHLHRGRAAAAAALALLLSLTAPPAHAEDLVMHDGRADMWRLVGDQQYVPAPRVENGDIVRTAFRHTARRVVITTRFARLVPHDFAFVARTRDEDDRRRIVHLLANRRNPQGTVSLLRGANEVRCDIWHHIDYGMDRLRIRFPRSCIHDPRWLEFAAWSIHKTRTNHYYDNANSPSAPHPPVWTPRLHSA